MYTEHFSFTSNTGFTASSVKNFNYTKLKKQFTFINKTIFFNIMNYVINNNDT